MSADHHGMAELFPSRYLQSCLIVEETEQFSHRLSSKRGSGPEVVGDPGVQSSFPA